MRYHTFSDQIIRLGPSPMWAFVKAFPYAALSLIFLILAIQIHPFFIWLSVPAIGTSAYRYLSVRQKSYLIGPGFIHIKTGLFFKRTLTVEIYQVKDYLIEQSLAMQVLRLMNLSLKSTDPADPLIVLQAIPCSDIAEQIRQYVIAARLKNPVPEYL